MILIAIGANLPVGHQLPLATCRAALKDLSDKGIEIVRVSSWYESPAWPPSVQPNFVNGIAEVKTALSPERLLQVLHGIEAAYGRTRGAKNAARTLDLDLITYDDVIQTGPPELPHPRMADRAFVLAPLCEIAPDWVHPVIGVPAAALIEKIFENQPINRISESG
ncbi:MAG: 2-amino-4-hydroxy-6-hydroxymethyldihydropteridine diphosphokinase [Rhodobacteraceae bacterium]|nr:2-amino-4-hydroxy-6-hydroxymethyldihydropteridine diphosphokinase [Paracoccaceae bacterium]